jgi:hypothetical protein
MIGEKQRRFVESAVQYVAPHIQAAIVQLAEARDYARDVDCDPWDFAVEVRSLTALELAACDLCWLISNGYVEHAREVSRPGSAVRKFRAAKNVRFTEKSCFVLTDAGLQLTTSELPGHELRRAA